MSNKKFYNEQSKEKMKECTQSCYNSANGQVKAKN